jgi:hypothetical protein
MGHSTNGKSTQESEYTWDSPQLMEETFHWCLDRQAGLISPQFHVKYDPLFHSVMQDTFDSKWQERAGFIKQEVAPKKKTIKQKASNNNESSAFGVPFSSTFFRS